jgi:ribosomal protein S18 acetylase RimI-like enzyme
MTSQELSDYAKESLTDYIGERIKSGEDPADAHRIGTEQMAGLFPQGVPADGQLVFCVLDDDDNNVGTLWIGPRTPEQTRHFWVWDIAIDETHRGKGLGRATMQLAEAESRSHGATELGLNVFGHNEVARHLYESMGYTTTAVNMRKLF